jgi:hypothetical protein
MGRALAHRAGGGLLQVRRNPAAAFGAGNQLLGFAAYIACIQPPRPDEARSVLIAALQFQGGGVDPLGQFVGLLHFDGHRALLGQANFFRMHLSRRIGKADLIEVPQHQKGAFTVFNYLQRGKTLLLLSSH